MLTIVVEQRSRRPSRHLHPASDVRIDGREGDTELYVSSFPTWHAGRWICRQLGTRALIMALNSRP
jgi:hypothetical protein